MLPRCKRQHVRMQDSSRAHSGGGGALYLTPSAGLSALCLGRGARGVEGRDGTSALRQPTHSHHLLSHHRLRRRSRSLLLRVRTGSSAAPHAHSPRHSFASHRRLVSTATRFLVAPRAPLPPPDNPATRPFLEDVLCAPLLKTSFLALFRTAAAYSTLQPQAPPPLHFTAKQRKQASIKAGDGCRAAAAQCWRPSPGFRLDVHVLRQM